MKPSWWSGAPGWLKAELGGDDYHLPGTRPEPRPVKKPFGGGRRSGRVRIDVDRIPHEDVVRRW